MKENWILYDSFKRAQKIYMKLVDGALLPTFVADSTGRVLYANSRGKALFVESRANAEDKDRSQQRLQRGGANLLELIHPERLKTVEGFLKRGPREKASLVDVPLLCKGADEKLAIELETAKAEGKADPGLDLSLLARGNTYSSNTCDRVRAPSSDGGESGLEGGKLRSGHVRKHHAAQGSAREIAAKRPSIASPPPNHLR